MMRLKYIRDMKKRPSLLLLLFIFVMSCQQERPEVQKEITFSVPEFNPDSSFQFVADQVAFGPRVPNTKGHTDCANYLVDELKSMGLEPVVQEFESYGYDGTRYFLKNIFASIHPNAKRRILLAAHWDTRGIADKDSERQDQPIDGANDGASGVAVVLEIARTIVSQDLKPDIGVDLILFDGEDQGAPINFDGKFSERFTNEYDYCLGSSYWAKNKHDPKYSAYYGILFDMVGGKNGQFYYEQNSTKIAPALVRRVWENGAKLGFARNFVPKNGGYVVDDHIPVIKHAQIQMIDIIEFDPSTPSNFSKTHHRHSDNLENISKETMKAVGQTVLYTIYQEGK